MTRFEKWSVLSSSLATATTGLGYLGIKYLMQPSDPWSVINHPLQPWLLKAHIVVAPLLVFAVGMIAVPHVWQHFQRGVRAGRRSGLVTATVFAPMVITGYLIQSVTAEEWLRVITWAHIATSLAFSAGLGAHTVFFLRRVAWPESSPEDSPSSTTLEEMRI